MLKMLANIITSLRIVGTAVLLFITPMSKLFYVIYTLCGVTDIVDGFVARATKTTSELGARLDSIADILFYTVMLSRVFPILKEKLPWWIWIGVVVIILIRCTAYSVAALKYHRFASVHTYMNKLSGAVVFTVPYFIKGSLAIPFSLAICIIAGIASTEELVIHLCNKSYSVDKKTLIPIEGLDADKA